MNCEEAHELITALVDQELSAPEQRALEAHLRECPGCSLVTEQEQEIKQAIRGRAKRLRAPAGLRRSILAHERTFPRTKVARPVFHRTRMVRRAALAAAWLIAVVLPVFLLQRPGSEPIATAALERYEALARSEIPPVDAEKPDELVARLVREASGHIHPMGYDLSAMGLQPAAGTLQKIHGREVLVVIYRGEGGTLFCYTFSGTEADAPGYAAKFFDPAKQMNFYAFSHGTVNAVLHREGELICILASEMPMQDLLELARSKARAS
jgi:anti-sigma factor (TIGR02949 family)